MGCDLEIDVNGEEIFFVDKEILSNFSNKLRNKFIKQSVSKVILHDFPGGPESFELFTKFCYGNGNLQLTPFNSLLFHFAARFMEMDGSAIVKFTEKSLENIPNWSWPELVNGLKQLQDLSPISEKKICLFEKITNSIMERINLSIDAIPMDSSPDSSMLRFSCDTKSTISTKNGTNSRNWWFEDLVILKPEILEKFVETAMLHKIDHGLICRFLFYYLKSRFVISITIEEKKRVIEVTIELLDSLDRKSISCKGLFGILRISCNLKINEGCKCKLEAMIGSKIDQATLDNLLIPSPIGKCSLYDVNLVLRFLGYFLNENNDFFPRLKKVGNLMDLYLAEVAPDPTLKPGKFTKLTSALPSEARDCHDSLYRAIDIYFQVHPRLTEEEKIKICSALNYEKLTSDCCRQLTKNPKFPPRTAIQALVSHHSILKSLLNETNNHLKPISNNVEDEQVILYAKRVELTMENENLKALLEGMHWRVMELEKICCKLKGQMANMKDKDKKFRSNNVSRSSLPRLCS